MAQGIRTFTVEYTVQTAPRLPVIRRLDLTPLRAQPARIPRLSLRTCDAGPHK